LFECFPITRKQLSKTDEPALAAGGAKWQRSKKKSYHQISRPRTVRSGQVYARVAL